MSLGTDVFGRHTHSGASGFHIDMHEYVKEMTAKYAAHIEMICLDTSAFSVQLTADQAEAWAALLLAAVRDARAAESSSDSKESDNG